MVPCLCSRHPAIFMEVAQLKPYPTIVSLPEWVFHLWAPGPGRGTFHTSSGCLPVRKFCSPAVEWAKRTYLLGFLAGLNAGMCIVPLNISH